MANESSDPLKQAGSNLGDTCQQVTITGYLALPSMLRSRLPTITSLRQAAIDVVTRPVISSRTSSADDCQPSTNTASSSRRGSVHSIEVTRSTTASNASSPRLTGSDHERQALAVHSIFDLDAPNQHLQPGGIDWLLAGAGVRLWLNAQRQAELSNRDPAHLRSMYIDALKYMNMALPPDLSSLELETIQASLPPQLLLLRERNNQDVFVSKPNLLRQTVAQAVCWLIALTMLLIPLLMTAANRILIYERQHRVTQRVLSRSADITKALGEQGIVLGHALVQFRDTPLGKAGTSFVVWFVEGVVAGVGDGYKMSTEHERHLQ